MLPMGYDFVVRVKKEKKESITDLCSVASLCGAAWSRRGSGSGSGSDCTKGQPTWATSLAVVVAEEERAAISLSAESVTEEAVEESLSVSLLLLQVEEQVEQVGEEAGEEEGGEESCFGGRCCWRALGFFSFFALGLGAAIFRKSFMFIRFFFIQFCTYFEVNIIYRQCVKTSIACELITRKTRYNIHDARQHPQTQEIMCWQTIKAPKNIKIHNNIINLHYCFLFKLL